MGNCLVRSSNRVLAEDDDDVLHLHPHRKEEEKAHDVKVKEAAKRRKKTVSFRLHEEEEEEDEDEIHENGGGVKENPNNNDNGKGDPKSGVVRIKVVLTRQELKQLVMGSEMPKDNNNNSQPHISCVEELLNVIKSRGRMVSEIKEGRPGIKNDGSWRPSLESIAEESY
ncbi:uncharacterized protein LOC107417068 [Ziziphus jujuba]|uniref:Uncharacterized protein LOC107417068 n=1 Tax=Ziziphus jujuba TaxID=326968 RepID=A0A6P4A5Q9_ZIZJJ|nr:uncharacterized protein LOC107417068 [Ziziphus jujuba]